MYQETAKQIKQLVDNSKRVLITTGRNYSGDGLASALALLLIFNKLNKYAEVVIDCFNLPAEYRFLPGVEQIKAEVKKLKKYLISLDISQTGLEELAYDVVGNTLRIHLTPARGVLQPSDLHFQTSEFSFDLIFTVAVQDLESIGSLYDFHRDLFYKIPVINIDASPTNDNYGHVNLIDVTATATAEIIYYLIKDLDLNVLDEELATCLLTGLISATKSFKTPNVTPRCLTLASELINLGANRQEIVTRLYQTKTIATLKLWGKILSRLQADNDKKLIWSKLDPHDFIETGSDPKNIQGALEELISASPQAEVVVLMYQIQPQDTHVIIYSPGAKNAIGLSRKYSPLGDKNNAFFTVNKPLAEVEDEIINHLKTQL